MSGIHQTAPMTAPHITLDQSICIGSASCTRLAPGAFVFDDHRQVAAVADLSAVELERLRIAERSCPTGAIFFEEEPPA